MFAALNSVEPHVAEPQTIDLFNAQEDWAKLRRPAAEKIALARLDGIVEGAGRSSSISWATFTAADLLMTTVLRFLRHTDWSSDYPILGRTRPAARRGPRSSARSRRR